VIISFNNYLTIFSAEGIEGNNIYSKSLA